MDYKITSSPLISVLLALALSLAGVLPAVFWAFLLEQNLGYLYGFLAAGPVEEVLKPLGVYVALIFLPNIPRKSFLVVVFSIICALLFASIENYVYLHFYFPKHPPELAHFRWRYCTLLHIVCSTTYSFSILKNIAYFVQKSEKKPSLVFPLVAMTVHNLYNIIVTIFIEPNFPENDMGTVV
jgi:RsiW-degrading membrane proteinase PrsW (M82 family)